MMDFVNGFRMTSHINDMENKSHVWKLPTSFGEKPMPADFCIWCVGKWGLKKRWEADDYMIHQWKHPKKSDQPFWLRHSWFSPWDSDDKVTPIRNTMITSGSLCEEKLGVQVGRYQINIARITERSSLSWFDPVNWWAWWLPGSQYMSVCDNQTYHIPSGKLT